MPIRVPFNRPFVVGDELTNIAEAVRSGQLAGVGAFTRRCESFLQDRFGIHRVLMTSSCTAALEMSALLLDLRPGDEVIMPAFTFVSTANAFVRAGARPVFVDVRPDTLNLDETRVEASVTDRTRAMVPVHYGGIACQMDAIGEIASRHNLTVIEDAAQAVNARYRDHSLGGIGALGAFSFHETKNFNCGEGGALCVNEERFVERAEIIRDKGTNRQQFDRGQVDKYSWVDIGSSYVASELNCAFLWSQLERMDQITDRRAAIFERYRRGLQPLEEQERLRLPYLPDDCASNHHLFYILLPDTAGRDRLMHALHEDGILAVFHYVPLHSSPMGRALGTGSVALPVTDDVSGRVLRLPMFYELTEPDQDFVIERVHHHLAS
ncbi:MAG: dTDP-4-amino-4,6-dideoxygalactose transaminase [Ilumatobacter sp.]|nr:dTDP-4-amino-4,6-dideoxygalactose transaminase [Ilumatobacter sp.]